MRNSWEEKAQQNPLFAVQTTEDMQDALPQDFSQDQVERLFDRGRRLYRERIGPLLETLPGPKDTALIVEYGCGVGRILRAIVDAGYRCAGIDISPTMLAHCRDLVPEVEAACALGENGRSSLPDGQASLVFTYAVVQHISTLTAYVMAIDEMCRVLKPGGVLAIHLNCEDFATEPPTRTENHETFSLHYQPGEAEPYFRHAQDQWTGVYIGFELLARLLAERGVEIERRFHHNPEKLRGLWVVGRKVGA